MGLGSGCSSTLPQHKESITVKELLKFGLIGGAAVFLLKDQIAGLFHSASGQPPSAPPVIVPVAPPIAPAPIVTPTRPATPPATPAVMPSPAPTDQVIERAATNASWAAVLPTFKLNVDQWNWYRNAYLRRIGEPERQFEGPESYLPDGAPRDLPITATEYHQFRQSRGLGLIQPAVWGHSGAWS